LSTTENVQIGNYDFDDGVFEYESSEAAQEIFQKLADEGDYSIGEPVQDTEILYSGRIRLRRKATRHGDIIITETSRMEEKLEELSERYLEE